MNRAIPAHTLAKQRKASNPAVSAWVSAHAGSGKTHVLARRVVRLLLEGVAPARLICLTFTKAAAANMSERVFRTLAGWTLMSDEKLRAEIDATGAAIPHDLDIARRLFALAVETPGGLKIQTIHAFCERVLHLFPFEANVPADFRVVEDLERLELLQAARDDSLREAAGDERLAHALERVAKETWDGGFHKALDALLSKRDLLREPDALIARLPEALGLTPGETEAEIERRIIHDGISCIEWPAIAEALGAGGVNDKKAAEKLQLAASYAPEGACIEPYVSLFLTEGALRKSIATAAAEKLSPGLQARLNAEGERILLLQDKLSVARTRARSQALVLLAADILRRYTRIKQARSLLDFEDLIARTRRLFLQDRASSWVLYKLDGGVDHILVDEAQDTSEAQWEILRALASEFTSGAGAQPRPRTFFAVGDEKQSIFSFQGAAPAAFARVRKEFEISTRSANRVFEPVQLDLSFRSATAILEAVDKVFENETARRGLTAELDAAPRHAALKHDVRGVVEIWPVLRAQKTPDPESWVLPLDLVRESDPAVQLAQRIADRIAEMTAEGSRERISAGPPGSLRPITPGDVMILVRRRGGFFEAMVRALKERKVPVAGADRLDVGGHIAVMDMIAAARTALLPDDDLTLACVLKSPLCGLDDDDLMAFAPKRNGSLWNALTASVDPKHRAVVERIAGWRESAHNARPFDFFSRLLGPQGGRRAFVARMGPEAGDALDELLALALAHERQEPPSLTTFVHALETIDLQIKRDMEAAGGLVRVMTAHAAKGLEAPVVVLPDTCAVPSRTYDPLVYELDTPAGKTFAWSARKSDDAPAVARRRAAAQVAADDEYRRLLYVAMTRAEERLYIAGHAGANDPPAGCWRTLAHDALAPLCAELDDPAWPEGKILRLGAPLFDEAMVEPPPAATPPEPGWLRRATPPEPTPAPPLRPSTTLAGADVIERDDAARAGAAPVARGLIVHALMQNLPVVDKSRRYEVAIRYVRARAPGLPHEAAGAIAGEAIAALAAPDCAPLFNENSRAEVGIAARIERNGGKPIDIAGRIDRLAEVDDEVWIADFKTGAPAVVTPANYVAQLALYRAAVGRLYPGRRVRAFILWTAAQRLDEIPAAALDSALDRL